MNIFYLLATNVEFRSLKSSLCAVDQENLLMHVKCQVGDLICHFKPKI